MSHGCGPSTRMALKPTLLQTFWPGRGYVTWVGIDGYYFRPSDTFNSVFGPTIDQVRKLTSKTHSPVRDRRRAFCGPTRQHH